MPYIRMLVLRISPRIERVTSQFNQVQARVLNHPSTFHLVPAKRYSSSILEYRFVHFEYYTTGIIVG